jgi:enoyl-CoA hydratase/carnithine racemase
MHGSTLLLTINRPEKRNAFTPAVIGTWIDALVRARSDAAVKSVVITGAGDLAFCSGADFSAYGSINLEIQTPETIETESEFAVHRISIATADLDKPYISAVNGAAVGAGLGMALMTDIRFLSDRARVCEGYINVGVFPGDGDTYYLPRMAGVSNALMMMWTGDMIDAEECLRTGIATRVFPHERLLEETMAFTDRLASKPQSLIRSIKRATYSGLHMTLHDSLNMIEGFTSMAQHAADRRGTFEQFKEKREHQ